jgi:hypothetical protein
VHHAEAELLVVRARGVHAELEILLRRSGGKITASAEPAAAASP